jgi:beta-fructofuranosidase
LPQPGAGEEIFSGSIVIDENNTSGFFNILQPGVKYGVVAIYTRNTPLADTQWIQYSTDGGYAFQGYTHNPVIDSNSTQFRDPKVTWYNDHWVMVFAYSGIRGWNLNVT